MNDEITVPIDRNTPKFVPAAMSIKINGKTYKLDTSFAALIRFRAKHGISVFDLLSGLEKPENAALLIRLLYDGIIDIDIAFDLSALQYAKSLISYTVKTRKRKTDMDADAKDVEITFFALAVLSGIDTEFMRISPLSGVIDAVTSITGIKGGKADKKYKKLTKQQVAKMYAGQPIES